MRAIKTALEFVILCSNRWLKIEVTARQKKRVSAVSAKLHVRTKPSEVDTNLLAKVFPVKMSKTVWTFPFVRIGHLGGPWPGQGHPRKPRGRSWGGRETGASGKRRRRGRGETGGTEDGARLDRVEAKVLRVETPSLARDWWNRDMWPNNVHCLYTR